MAAHVSNNISGWNASPATVQMKHNPLPLPAFRANRRNDAYIDKLSRRSRVRGTRPMMRAGFGFYVADRMLGYEPRPRYTAAAQTNAGQGRWSRAVKVFNKGLTLPCWARRVPFHSMPASSFHQVQLEQKWSVLASMDVWD